MTTIEIKRELSKEFLSDVMVTAFDGNYGACWTWADPVGRFWLESEQNPENMDPAYSFWMKAHIRVNPDEPTGDKILDREDGFVIDHEAIARGISIIINDDYVGVWREARPHDVRRYDSLAAKAREQGFTESAEMKQEFRHENGVLQVFTHETARGLRQQIAFAVDEQDAGEIDADCADAIVQAAAFGRVIFG